MKTTSAFLSAEFLRVIKSRRFIELNRVTPDEFLRFWSVGCRIVETYENSCGVVPTPTRVGCLIEEIAKARWRRCGKQQTFEQILRSFLNGQSGYSLYVRFPKPKSYIALNQIELYQESKKIYAFINAARLLEYPIRMVHEDVHHTQFENKDYLNWCLQNDRDTTIEQVVEFFAQLIQSDFAEYFLKELSAKEPQLKLFPFCRIQFPSSSQVRTIICDTDTQDYASTLRESAKNDGSDFEIIFPEVLSSRAKMFEKAEADLSEWHAAGNFAADIVQEIGRKQIINFMDDLLTKSTELPSERVEDCLKLFFNNRTQ
jgi:hypothetical protein